MAAKQEPEIALEAGHHPLQPELHSRLHHIPAHRGIPENELADQLAKKAAGTSAKTKHQGVMYWRVRGSPIPAPPNSKKRRHPQASHHQPPRRQPTLLDLGMRRAQGVQNLLGQQPKNKRPRRPEPMDVDDEKGDPQIPSGNIWCPVPRCPNHGSRGYVPTGFVKHVKNQHQTYLDQRYPQLVDTLRDLGLHVCCKCATITSAEIDGSCLKCFKDDSADMGKIKHDTDAPKRVECLQRIRKANATRLKILADIPKPLRRLWAKVVAYTLLQKAKPKTESQALEAEELWSKLKACLVHPRRSGKRRRRSTIHFWRKQVTLWIAGDHAQAETKT